MLMMASTGYTGVPTVKLLTSLPIPGDGAKRKNLNIIQRTSTCYTKLAMYLLDDDNCEIVDCLKEKCRGDPEEIVTAVYKKWIIVLEGNLLHGRH